MHLAHEIMFMPTKPSPLPLLIVQFLEALGALTLCHQLASSKEQQNSAAMRKRMPFSKDKNKGNILAPYLQKC